MLQATAQLCQVQILGSAVYIEVGLQMIGTLQTQLQLYPSHLHKVSPRFLELIRTQTDAKNRSHGVSACENSLSYLVTVQSELV